MCVRVAPMRRRGPERESFADEESATQERLDELHAYIREEQRLQRLRAKLDAAGDGVVAAPRAHAFALAFVAVFIFVYALVYDGGEIAPPPRAVQPPPPHAVPPVSYTHLTLPTICSV